MDADRQTQKPSGTIAWLPLVAAIVALVGLGDSIYLTIHHYTAEAVPCGEMFDCEMVLTSPYSTMWGIPQALFGAVAYFIAFSLALLTAFGNRVTWVFFSILVTLMAGYSVWLIYVQAYYIHAFCQFCLLSAGTTFTLFLLFIVSTFIRRR